MAKGLRNVAIYEDELTAVVAGCEALMLALGDKPEVSLRELELPPQFNRGVARLTMAMISEPEEQRSPMGITLDEEVAP